MRAEAVSAPQAARRGPAAAALRGPATRPALRPDASHCACGGSCPGCQAAGRSRGPVIQRAPKPGASGGSTTTATPGEQDYRDFVQATIDLFNRAASNFADPLVSFDAAHFDTFVDNWYSMVADRQKMIKDHLNGDVLLDRNLQAAYIAAIHALMSKAAKLFGKTEDELYGTNSGRIPMWAWQSPHRQEAGISTPLDQGQAVDPLSGNVGFTTPTGIAVTILPDGVGVTDPNNPQAAGTKLDLPFSVPFTSQIVKKVERIVTITPPVPAATIQTFYPPGVYASGSSGYGRGTTPEDIAGGKVDPRSTTLGWHEGNHGLDYIAFLKANPLPAFTGAPGITRAQFDAAVAAYRSALQAYVARATKASNRLTHCVGTTIDQYNQANAAPGAKVTLECTP